eukprot:scaffold106170_cov69-Phaeocystis_antarctica.AAC.3
MSTWSVGKKPPAAATCSGVRMLTPSVALGERPIWRRVVTACMSFLPAALCIAFEAELVQPVEASERVRLHRHHNDFAHVRELRLVNARDERTELRWLAPACVLLCSLQEVCVRPQLLIVVVVVALRTLSEHNDAGSLHDVDRGNRTSDDRLVETRAHAADVRLKPPARFHCALVQEKLAQSCVTTVRRRVHLVVNVRQSLCDQLANALLETRVEAVREGLRTLQ